jgi:hypothetical protein
MNVYCDNYKTCNQVIMDWSKDRPSDDRIRAAGWRTYSGQNLSGDKHLEAVLCGQCAGNQKREAAPKVLAGQEELFSVEES